MTEILFKGKEFVWNHHLAVPFRPLVMHPDKGVGEPRLDGNLIVQGDNLHALKALLPTYAGKVDCIFIDPPYNTGNEGWAYSDNVNAPMIKEWLITSSGLAAFGPSLSRRLRNGLPSHIKLPRISLVSIGVLCVTF